MKKYISHLVFALLGCAALSACVDDDYMELDKGQNELVLTASKTEVVLNEQAHADDALELSWTTGTNYGTGNKISYTLELTKTGSDFADSYVAVENAVQEYSWKKKVVSALLCATMVATMFAGCGSKESSDNATTPDTSKADTSSEVTAPAEDTGKVLNIYCWNEEFKSRITAHYPDYQEVDATHGKIGDVDVVWNITPNDDNAYQNNLDATLLNQADAPADDKIDLFLVEADYALKYVDTDYTMPIKDLGITDSDLSKQYQYTKDIVTDSNGVLKGLSWQGCPGVLFYNRDAAKEVLGTDDPDKVQESVKDWDTYNDTAKKMKDAGYKMTASANDTYRVYSNNVTST